MKTDFTARPDANPLRDESLVARALLDKARPSPTEKAETERLARRLVRAAREGRRPQGGLDAFMQEYSLSSEEGVVLMCLAEALLRIPDADTADRLIADKIGGRDWDEHVGRSDSLFVNASTWGLMLTGRVVDLGRDATSDMSGFLGGLIRKSGEPIIRRAMRHAMRIMGRQFVLGRTIEEALEAAAENERLGYRHSYDMLGEAAVTAADAERHFRSYRDAILGVAKAAPAPRTEAIHERPSVSVKLSALHPRHEPRKAAALERELLPRAIELCTLAKERDLGLTIDAEEADKLEPSLVLFERLARETALAGWNGLGLAVQAYGRRAYPALEWLAELAERTGRRLPVRLVKGAYWDTEIKLAQETGLENYPVFTRKVSTDVSFLACARFMLSQPKAFHPQFATHNAHSLAAVLAMAGKTAEYEFQRLHGMGQALHDEIVGPDKENVPCRIYAPVGSHEDLLAYLARRLLENGANTSFVNRLANDEAPVSAIIADPVERLEAVGVTPHPEIPAPSDIFAPRVNSSGLPLWHEPTRTALLADMQGVLQEGFSGRPLTSARGPVGPARPVFSPHDRGCRIGEIVEATPALAEAAVSQAAGAQDEWDKSGGANRARILRRAADLYEAHAARLMAVIVREAGKTLDNAQADLREAVDFLRYYADRAQTEFDGPEELPGPTGERNESSLHGRGVFACISPWNFPLAIFTGQVSAALAAGNSALAKPAEQTPLTACEAVKLLHEAGVPGEILHLLPGDGAAMGTLLVSDMRVNGVAFTGSNETAGAINRSLAERSGPIVPLIAETGGVNAMIVDSTALPEQAVRDLTTSAYDSAGQRCSAARVAFVQEDVAPRFISMLQGAVEQLQLGDPLDYAVDVGPVIDEDARATLEAHKSKMASTARRLVDPAQGPDTKDGTFVTPAAYEIDALTALDREVFGPIVHVLRYESGKLDAVCDAVNAGGYGLTLGIHSRIESTVAQVRSRVRVGNLYVNRNQIGAVVGAQPFGGEGLSGTGPKAGGPLYLHRFATERTVSTDATASGGNAALMSMGPSTSAV